MSQIFIQFFFCSYFTVTGPEEKKTELIFSILWNIYELAQQKYASNAVEKCLAQADGFTKEYFINRIALLEPKYLPNKFPINFVQF